VGIPLSSARLHLIAVISVASHRGIKSHPADVSPTAAASSIGSDMALQLAHPDGR